MTDWTARIANRFSVAVSRLYIVSDPDCLLQAEALLDRLRIRGFEVISYGDPLEFRYLYERELRPRLAESASGLILTVRGAPGSEVPYDVLVDGLIEEIGFGDLVPRLDPTVLDDMPRDKVGNLVETYERSPTAGSALPLTASDTREFLLREVYPLPPITSMADLITYLTHRHYVGDVLPPSLDEHIARRVSTFVPTGVDLTRLLRDREQFFHWLQTEWNAFASSLDTPSIREDSIPFEHAPLRVYIDNLFNEGLLERVEVAADDVAGIPDWMRPGLRAPGDDPATECRLMLDRTEIHIPEDDAGYEEWIDFGWRWGTARWRIGALATPDHEINVTMERIQRIVESRFEEWVEKRFGSLTTLPVATVPVVVSHIASVLRRAIGQGDRVALIVVDGLALEHWLNIRHAFSSGENWDVDEQACFAWIPTVTSISRQSVFSGRSPRLFADSWNTTAKESTHWQRIGTDIGLPKDGAYYARLRLQEWDHARTLASREQEILNHRLRLLGIVINDIDEIIHGNTLGMAQMHRDVGLWAAQGRFESVIDELIGLGFTVYVTSDHGSVECVGAGRPSEGVLVEQRAARARIYSEQVFAQRVLDTTPHARLWPSIGLPEGLHVLVAHGPHAFAPSDQRGVAHGGISLEEVIVPFVRIRSHV